MNVRIRISRILTYQAFQLIGPFLRQLITEHVLTRSIPLFRCSEHTSGNNIDLYVNFILSFKAVRFLSRESLETVCISVVRTRLDRSSNLQRVLLFDRILPYRSPSFSNEFVQLFFNLIFSLFIV